MTNQPRIPRAITIAGSDSGGGAGIQADLKTFMAFGVYCSSVVTALTAQNTREVLGIWRPDPEAVYQQIEAVMSDIGADAGKTGMLVDAKIIEAVARGLERWPIEKLVVDPVMISKSGAHLLAGGGVDAMDGMDRVDSVDRLRKRILPKAYLLTPNIPEAEALTGDKIDDESSMKRAAEKLVSMGARSVLIKGGHSTDPDRSDDLFFDGSSFKLFKGRRIESRNTHGTGCTLSAAIAANLALGKDLVSAIAAAKNYLAEAIATAPAIGSGAGPVNHMAYKNKAPGGMNPPEAE